MEETSSRRRHYVLSPTLRGRSKPSRTTVRFTRRRRPDARGRLRPCLGVILDAKTGAELRHAPGTATASNKWLAGAEARATRQREDRILAEEIREVHGESGGAYGSPRVTAELREKGRRVNEKRIARIMRTFSITGIRLRRRVRTTVPDPAASPVPDLFQRDFTATEPGRKYMGDITYLPLAGGEFLCLATVLEGVVT